MPLDIVGATDTNTSTTDKQLIYDEAGLLTPEQVNRLNAMANQYGAERETDIIVYTSLNTENKDEMVMTEDFYDEHAPGYDKPHGNAVILTLDMYNRDIYLAGFYKAEEYLDDSRLDQIQTKITSDLVNGDYELAFEKYIQTVHEYMGYRPGVNPENILFKFWFQLVVSLGLGGVIVGVMAYRSGGRVTVNRQTYEDASTSGILDRQDRYLRTTVTKRKIERNNNNNGPGGGGGGISKGGHSHSGSRGSF
ncbi:TPM domain-containing protein [Paenibacillus sp. Marseille-Q4541]|uniref:TPM domain-containing protein n=1 Tax=Paenibacillus sp. Marseille-Q4541 TaxID=2831522 RepID=UPI0032D5AA0C